MRPGHLTTFITAEGEQTGTSNGNNSNATPTPFYDESGKALTQGSTGIDADTFEV
jgi:hypothetical protein